MTRCRTLAALVPLALATTACSGGFVQLKGPTGLFSLVVLVLDVLAIVKILQGGGSAGHKALWIVVILLLPLLGLILWYLLGRK